MRDGWRSVLFIFWLVLLGVTPNVAQQAIVGCEGLNCKLTDLLAIPVNIFNYLLSGAALVLLLMIIWAGIRMTMYWFNEQPEQELTAAKMTLTRAIVGFAIVTMAILIVNILAVQILGLYPGSGLYGIVSGLLY